ncbi:MAG: FAD-dependent oxidoreductase [Armatimonadetes bacterium]|nr:FAD-dependent oxidoreductase [Armatimonadota bacterium]
MDDLTALGGGMGHVRDTVGVAYSITPVNPEVLKVVLDRKVLSSGAALWLHTFLSSVSSDSNRVEAVIVEGKSGRQAICAKIFVDATGDGDLSSWAGATFEKGRSPDGKAQPMTLIFRMAPVNLEKVISYMEEHKEEFHHETLFGELRTHPILGVSGFSSLFQKAQREEGLPIQRDRLLFFSSMRRDEVIINTTRVLGFDGTQTSDLTRAEVEGRAQMLALADFLRFRIPGFENSFITASATQIGVRETRRIIGDYVLTAEDVMTGRKFHDGIAFGGFAIDIHDPAGKGVTCTDPTAEYHIPYRCLLPIGLGNVLTAGRCISATHEAFASSRVQATCMAVGQAAGTAAALAARKGIKPRELDSGELRRILAQQGALV